MSQIPDMSSNQIFACTWFPIWRDRLWVLSSLDTWHLLLLFWRQLMLVQMAVTSADVNNFYFIVSLILIVKVVVLKVNFNFIFLCCSASQIYRKLDRCASKKIFCLYIKGTSLTWNFTHSFWHFEIIWSILIDENMCTYPSDTSVFSVGLVGKGELNLMLVELVKVRVRWVWAKRHWFLFYH